MIVCICNVKSLNVFGCESDREMNVFYVNNVRKKGLIIRLIEIVYCNEYIN